MHSTPVESQITRMQQRIIALEQHTTEESSQSLEALSEMLEELHTAMEELSVADEQLRNQNEALTEAHTVMEAERQRYLELFDFAPRASLVPDPAGGIGEANQAAGALLGRQPKHLLGKPLGLFVTHEQRTAFRTTLRRLPRLVRVEEWESRLQPLKGTAFPAALTVAIIRDPQGTVVGLRWLLRDISQQKQAEEILQQAHASLECRVAERTTELQQMNVQLQTEVAERQRAADKAEQAEQALRSSHEQLRQLATYLQNAQEQERQRIARELHDDLAQMLTSMRMDVIWLGRRAVTAPAEWRERLTHMIGTIDTAGRAVRRIGTELRPDMLDTLGLSAAIEWQLQDVRQRTSLAYTFQLPPEE